MQAAAGPRIYNLFPTLAGPIKGGGGRDWYSHLERVAAMNFDWLYVNPFHYPGFSGSLYAVKDPYRLHPLVQGDSEEPADRLLGDFLTAAAGRGLRFMLDLVVNHTAKDALLTETHAECYLRQADGSLLSPRAVDPNDPSKVTVWGDLAELDYHTPASRRRLVDYWSNYLRHYLRLGVRGLRCDAAYQVPAEVWAELIAAARAVDPQVMFLAETLGASLEQVRALESAGFDYFCNSAKWWDFRAPWLLEQYESFRHIAPSVAFPESHDTERLAMELGDPEPQLAERHYRQRYLFSAVFSSGVLMPMGYEYGFRRRLNVVGTRPEQWEPARFDLSDFIAATNAMRAELPTLNREGPQEVLETGRPSLTVLARLAASDGAAPVVLTALNRSATESLEIDPRELLSRLPLPIDTLHDRTPLAPNGDLRMTEPVRLEPLDFRVWTGQLAAPSRSATDHSRAVAAAADGAGDEAAGLSQATVQAVVNADHGDVFAVLGMHGGGPGGGLVVRVLLPGAETVEVIDAASGQSRASLTRVHEAGFFAGAIPRRRKPFPYRLRVSDAGGTREIEDPYRFGQVLGETDLHLLGEGTHLQAHQRLGARPLELEGVAGVAFAVWAPAARRVSVVGDFNCWDGRRHMMRKHPGIGVWEIFVPGIGEGALYKYEIKAGDGQLLPLKSDPYAFATQHPPATASVVWHLGGHDWNDGAWLAQREQSSNRDRPISVYEVHLGSWRRVVEEGNRYLSYHELADQLVPYVKDLGFTHIELMPVSEYPFDGSWGYQPVGLFAPTSRFGSPRDFKHFIQRCHQEGIAVLMDWVPGHFPTDQHGLGYFDGTHLYEHADPRQGFHQDWSTLIYNYGRNEVRNYLLCNALFWMDEYHLDGLRVDAVASMLYLDYSRKAGEWIPNQYGGRENLDAVSLLQRMNELIYAQHPGAATVAEESTAWPAVSRPTYLGGLGFGYKWNMGWMHDTLEYLSREPIHRQHHHHEMTFGLLYAFSENFMLPLSHDEVVHGKGSLLARMPGDAWQKFANLRAYFGFMWTHPGKKLLFMGGEFAQGAEWSHERSLDWHLLEHRWHQGVQRLVRDLNWLYCNTPALHQLDCEPDGFQWLEANDHLSSVYAYARCGREGTPPLVVLCNFTPLVRHQYRVGVPEPAFYAERLNTDAEVYGGSNVGNSGGIQSEPVGAHGRSHSIAVTLPPLATVVLEAQRG